MGNVSSADPSITTTIDEQNAVDDEQQMPVISTKNIPGKELSNVLIGFISLLNFIAALHTQSKYF